MAQDGPKKPFDLLALGLIGYFPFDGDLNDPVTSPKQSASSATPPAFIPAWSGHQAVQVASGNLLIKFPPLHYPQPQQPFSQPREFALGFWVRRDVAGKAQLPFSDAYGFNVIITEGGTIQLGWVTEAWTTTGSVHLGLWTHVAMSYSAPGPIVSNPHVVSCWVNGQRLPDYVLTDDVNPQATFATAEVSNPVSPTDAGLSVRGFAMFNTALTDDAAMFLAADLFEPEAAYNPQQEYLAVMLPGAGAITGGYGPTIDFTYAAGFTLEGWLYTDLLDLHPGDQPSIIERVGCYGLGINDQGQLCGWVTDVAGTIATVTSAYPIFTSQWIHAALVVSQSGGLLLYVDGSPVLAATPLPAGAVPPTSTAPMLVGSGWAGDLYAAAAYNTPLTAEQILNLQTFSPDRIEDLPSDCVVYYDLSSSPPRSFSRTPGLQSPPVLPADTQYVVHSRGAALACGGHVDAGITTDTDLGFMATPLTITAWIKLCYVEGAQAVASRWKNGSGYSLYIDAGRLCCDIFGPVGYPSISVRSTVDLPLNVWVQVGMVTFLSNNIIKVGVFANGVVLAEVTLDAPSDAKSLGNVAPPDTPLMLGARLGPAADSVGATDAETTVVDVMSAYLASVSIYDQVLNPYYLYFVNSPQMDDFLIARWSFEGGAPTDQIGGHPAQLANGAWIATSRDVIGAASAAALTTYRAGRQPSAMIASPRRDDLSTDIPKEHLALLANSADVAGTIAVRKIDGRTYLMAYPADSAGEPYCALVTDGDDTTALWVQLTIDVILIGLGVWGLKPPAGTDKLTKVGVAMWRSEPVRQAFMALYAADVTMTPQAFLGAGQAMYREGFLSQVLGCFSLSWFTLARLVALFVPWVAVAFVVTDLTKVANDIWQRTRRKPDQPAPAVSAIAQKAVDVTGAVPITVNGDAVTAMVVLTAPPSAVVSVTGSQAMLVLSPQTLTFSPANWSVPQPVDITAAATDENSVPRDSRVRITWAGAGVVGEACVDMHVQVAKLVCPEEIELRQNDSGDYEADFELSISAEIASDAPVTVELKSPNGSDGQPTIEFQPSTLTFQNTAGLASLRGNKPPPQTVRASRKRAASGDDTTMTTVDAHSQPGKAVAQHRYNLRVRKPEITEEIVLTMVRAGSGNCFVLKNTSYQNGKPQNVETSVFDGGKPGTYKRMADYLPPPGSAIKYLLCTHYDDDHIAGLIDLMVARAADVGSVLFNPPSPLALDGVHEDPTATSNNIMSVDQAYRLVALATAAGKIICPVIGNPPASLKDPRFALPSLEFRFAGPTAVVAAENQAHPTNSIKINRASIMFLLASTTADSGFKMLMTGDGYNVLPRLDVTGPQPTRQKIDFLQVPHHGSVENSDTSLYRVFLAKHYLISSSYSAYSGAHPAVKVIQDIVAGATNVGHDNFTIWINDPNLPSDFQLPPPGNFAIYRLNQNESGGSFVYRTGQQISEPLNYTRLI